MSKIELDTNEIQPLINMLYLSNEPKVIKLSNYIKKDSLEKNQAEFGNTCEDYQNFMYEKFGIYLHNNMLSDDNRKDVDKVMDSKAKGLIKDLFVTDETQNN